eukprot:GFUD01101210.1.p2 GENE.GFUD01101210.1~~GFUD01101210.1.p2  ORF type:complete len:137 (+),score=32.45 GFUD01101210.1:36-446(+)
MEDQRDQAYKVFVHGVEASVQNRNIQSVFEKCGEVVDVFNSGKGFAFVTFSSAGDAADAIEVMDGKMLFGQRVSVKQARQRRSDGRDGRSDGRDPDRANEMINEAFQRVLNDPPSVLGPVNSGNWWLHPPGTRPPF